MLQEISQAKYTVQDVVIQDAPFRGVDACLTSEAARYAHLDA